MNIQPATPETFELLKQFVLPNEVFSVYLAEDIRKESENLFIISNQSKITNTNDILGILSCKGSISFCIPSKEPLDNDNFKSAFLKFSQENKIKCIRGEKQIADFLVSILAQNNQIPFQTTDYELMALEDCPNPPENQLSCDDYIKRCTEDDIESLLSIQKNYIKDEVNPKGKTVNDLETLMSLRKILKTQLVYALLTDEEIVAKVNSNAIGWNWVQIGGVFTHPLYRRNSYAWHLLYSLCKKIQKAQKSINLFVKETNYSALQLYKKLGFLPVGKFQISYF